MKQIPEIILIMEGGVLHQIISSTPVKVFNLDEDIFECDMEEPEYFEDREYVAVEIYPQKEFEKLKKEIVTEWNEKMDNHPSFIPDDEK